jgi:hypothetical protein
VTRKDGGAEYATAYLLLRDVLRTMYMVITKLLEGKGVCVCVCVCVCVTSLTDVSGDKILASHIQDHAIMKFSDWRMSTQLAKKHGQEESLLSVGYCGLGRFSWFQCLTRKMLNHAPIAP